MVHNQEYVQENEMHEVLGGFEKETNHLSLARHYDRMKVKKKREPVEMWTLQSQQSTE